MTRRWWLGALVAVALGLGAGAHSYAHLPGWGRRWSNERIPERYIAAVTRGDAAVSRESLAFETGVDQVSLTNGCICCSIRDDLKDAVKTSVINKRAGGMGLISGRKAFQRPMKEGVGLLNAIQDVYLNKAITIA